MLFDGFCAANRQKKRLNNNLHGGNSLVDAKIPEFVRVRFISFQMLKV